MFTLKKKYLYPAIEVHNLSRILSCFLHLHYASIERSSQMNILSVIIFCSFSRGPDQSLCMVKDSTDIWHVKYKDIPSPGK